MGKHKSDLQGHWGIKPSENDPGRLVRRDRTAIPGNKRTAPTCETSASKKELERKHPRNSRHVKPERAGIFEKMKGSGIWWIRYADAYGRERREKAGTRGIAIRLYQKPKNEALPGKQLPESIRRKQFFVSDLLELAADYVRSHYQGQRLGADGKDYRYSALKGAFGSRPADTVTGSGNRARPVKAGRRALCDNGLIRFAKVAELADAPDLGSGPARGGGSSPPFRTSKLLRARDTAQKCSKNFSGRILGS